MARGTYIYPPRPSMRLVTDTFSYCAEHLPAWNTISISGYHIREAGSTAVQEIAFTIANGIAYVEAALAAGLDVDAFAPRLSFFWNAHNNLFEEVAKYRAARRMWAKIMTERFGAKDKKSTLLRFHTQTGGSTLTAQQPENNIVRVTLQALAAALGGTQSLHTNGFDEALGLPTERAAKVALRTQQIVGYESGIADTVDPLAGSWFVESLTDEVEKGAWEYLERIDAMGGAVDAIEAQYMQQEIEQAAYAYAKAIDAEREDHHRRQQVRGRGARAHRCLPHRPRAPALPGGPGQAGTPGAGPGGGGRRPGRRGGGRPRHPEPVGAHEDGAGRHGHPGRGVRRAARGLRGVPPERLIPQWVTASVRLVRLPTRLMAGGPTSAGPVSGRHDRRRWRVAPRAVTWARWTDSALRQPPGSSPRAPRRLPRFGPIRQDVGRRSHHSSASTA